MKIWIVGKWIPEFWEVEGIFNSEEKALSICTEYDHFIMDFDLNKDYSDSSFQCGYYPFFNYDTKQWEKMAKKRVLKK